MLCWVPGEIGLQIYGNLLRAKLSKTSRNQPWKQLRIIQSVIVFDQKFMSRVHVIKYQIDNYLHSTDN